MKNKEIQEQRMKGYFIQATKEILRSEGLKALSVRNIADRAGYSYTTMYGYFKDINDLVFLCVHDFFEECLQSVKDKTKKSERGIAGLKASAKAYSDYFIQYPGVFDLFFIEKMAETSNKKSAVDTINLSLDKVCEDEWNYCISQGIIKAEDAEKMKEQMRYAVYGLLLLYLNRRIPASYTAFINLLNSQLDAILNAGVVHGGKGATINNSIISIKLGNNS